MWGPTLVWPWCASAAGSPHKFIIIIIIIIIIAQPALTYMVAFCIEHSDFHLETIIIVLTSSN